MHKLTYLFLLAIGLLFSGLNTSLANQMSLTAPAVDCSALQGTWAGYVSNPEQLFYDGGPWTISIAFKVDGDRFVGHVTAGTEQPSRTPDNIKQTFAKTVTGHCQQGKLTNVFLGNANDCGHFAEQSILLNAKTLVMHLPYENAMKGTDFITMLIKTSEQTNDTVSKIKVPARDNIESCH